MTKTIFGKIIAIIIIITNVIVNNDITYCVTDIIEKDKKVETYKELCPTDFTETTEILEKHNGLFPENFKNVLAVEPPAKFHFQENAYNNITHINNTKAIVYFDTISNVFYIKCNYQEDGIEKTHIWRETNFVSSTETHTTAEMYGYLKNKIETVKEWKNETQNTNNITCNSTLLLKGNSSILTPTLEALLPKGNSLILTPKLEPLKTRPYIKNLLLPETIEHLISSEVEDENRYMTQIVDIDFRGENICITDNPNEISKIKETYYYSIDNSNPNDVFFPSVTKTILNINEDQITLNKSSFSRDNIINPSTFTVQSNNFNNDSTTLTMEKPLTEKNEQKIKYKQLEKEIKAQEIRDNLNKIKEKLFLNNNKIKQNLDSQPVVKNIPEIIKQSPMDIKYNEIISTNISLDLCHSNIDLDLHSLDTTNSNLLLKDIIKDNNQIILKTNLISKEINRATIPEKINTGALLKDDLILNKNNLDDDVFLKINQYQKKSTVAQEHIDNILQELNSTEKLTSAEIRTNLKNIIKENIVIQEEGSIRSKELDKRILLSEELSETLNQTWANNIKGYIKNLYNDFLSSTKKMLLISLGLAGIIILLQTNILPLLIKTVIRNISFKKTTLEVIKKLSSSIVPPVIKILKKDKINISSNPFSGGSFELPPIPKIIINLFLKLFK